MGPLVAVSQAVFTKEPVEGLVAASADTAMVLMRGYITYNLLVVLLSQLILQLIYVNIVLYYRDLGLLGRNVDMQTCRYTRASYIETNCILTR